MDTVGIESIDTTFLAVVIGAVVLFVSLTLLVQGWVMRLCVRLCGGDDIGVFYSVAIVVCSMLASFAATCCLVTFVEQPSQWSLLGCSVAGGVGAIALMTKMDPLRGLGVYLLYSILGTIVTVAFAVLIGAACFVVIPSDKLTQFAKASDAYAEKAKNITGVIQQNGEFTQESGDGAFSLEAQLSSLRGMTDEKKKEKEKASNSSQPNKLDKIVGKGLFGDGAAKANEAMKKKSANVVNRAVPQNGAKKSAPAATSSYDGVTRTNPFATETPRAK